jgi:hypothetical protein
MRVSIAHGARWTAGPPVRFFEAHWLAMPMRLKFLTEVRRGWNAWRGRHETLPGVRRAADKDGCALGWRNPVLLALRDRPAQLSVDRLPDSDNDLR